MRLERNAVNPSIKTLPPIIAGPMLRHVDDAQVVIWLVSSVAAELSVSLYCGDVVLAHTRADTAQKDCIQLGNHAWVHLITLQPEKGVPEDTWLHYDVGIRAVATTLSATVSGTGCDEENSYHSLHELMPDICFEGEVRPRFVRQSSLGTVLHGSCRKPHYQGEDGFLAAENVLAAARSVASNQNGTHTTDVECGVSEAQATANQPSLLMLHGDQVYVDDVAGPMLQAIQQTVKVLGLRDESIAGSADVSSGRDLLEGSSHMYGRLQLLPDTKANRTMIETVFQGAEKPVFTSTTADNHLITLAEVLAMYLLVWSPELWHRVTLDEPAGLTRKQKQTYQRELVALRGFIEALPAVRRVMANIPVYMIFDDHDVTDDWNLTKDWEERAYGHAFSRRIIGNAMIGYLICQGWGNSPSSFSQLLMEQVKRSLEECEPQAHDELISTLLEFNGWSYALKTEPPMIVMDARTRRWASGFSRAFPSGLLDQQGLDELEALLLGQQAVLLVSSAPVFGVKLIEVIQRIFTWCGLSLVVDAENWMAHKGAAKGILGIFQHPETPRHFTIISGDVHYSFAYDVRLRRAWQHTAECVGDAGVPSTSPHIWQITSSGMKNQFPEKLLRLFDRLNRLMFAGYSPLNVFTRRRRMRIRSRRPGNHARRYRHQRLVNATGIGILKMGKDGQPVYIAVRTPAGEEIDFVAGYSSDWH